MVECFVPFVLVKSEFEGSNVIVVEGDGVNVFIGEFSEKLVE